MAAFRQDRGGKAREIPSHFALQRTASGPSLAALISAARDYLFRLAGMVTRCVPGTGRGPGDIRPDRPCDGELFEFVSLRPPR